MTNARADDITAAFLRELEMRWAEELPGNSEALQQTSEAWAKHGHPGPAKEAFTQAARLWVRLRRRAKAAPSTGMKP